MMITKAEEILSEADPMGAITPGRDGHLVAISAIEKALVAGEANYRQGLAELCAKFGWRTDGNFDTLVERIEHHVRELKAGINARNAVIEEMKGEKE